MILEFPAGDRIHRYNKSIVLNFNGKRKVLSTSPLNGGYAEDLTSVFNYDGNPGAGMACTMKAPTYEGHMRIIAAELGLDPDRTAGLSTAASMDNACIKSQTYEGLAVTAIVTGGVEVNGGRVGDPASFCENCGSFVPVTHGTINIILYIDADLPAGTLTRALVTCTEAKTAALQELMAGSNYSHGLATGSGTDGTIIICNAESDIRLTNAGKHSKLGELTGLTVKSAVKEALFLQTGISPGSQHSVLKRLKRYGVDENKFWEEYCRSGQKNGKSLSKAEFIHNIHTLDGRDDLVTLTSLFVHLLDQLDWGLLSAGEVTEQGGVLLKKLSEKLGITYTWAKQPESGHKETVEGMLDFIAALFAAACGGE